MADAIIHQYRRWLEYERDAHTKVVRSLDSVPAERRSLPEFQRAVSILAHVAAARKMWLIRLGELEATVTEFFPQGKTIEEVAGELDLVTNRWAGFLGRLSDEEIVQSFMYQSLDGGRFRNRIEDILTQLFGHSWYHRGQIAMLVKAAGGEPAVTDLVYWCREAVGEAMSQ
jgi:uncharacterized damage-inducible protein DinB